METFEFSTRFRAKLQFLLLLVPTAFTARSPVIGASVEENGLVTFSTLDAPREVHVDDITRVTYAWTWSPYEPRVNVVIERHDRWRTMRFSAPASEFHRFALAMFDLKPDLKLRVGTVPSAGPGLQSVTPDEFWSQTPLDSPWVSPWWWR